MKIRNKLTGEILEDVKNIDTSLTTIEIFYLDDGILRIKTEKDYHTFLQNWEDYEPPKEPLIKDEKIRKAVRTWVEANSLDVAQYDKAKDCLYSPWGCDATDTSVSISFDKLGMFKNLEHRRVYTVAELCGEKDE